MNIFKKLFGSKQKELANGYKIDEVIGFAFRFNGIQSFCMTAIPVGGKESEPFILPHNPMWNVIVHYHRFNKTWDPEDSFVWQEVNIPDLEGCSIVRSNQQMWVHRMLIEDANVYASHIGISSSNDLENYIPNWDYKKEQLYSQYCQSGMIYTFSSLSSYVKALSEGDESFWEWLFNNPGLSGYNISTLPVQYRKAFQQFLKICQ